MGRPIHRLSTTEVIKAKSESPALLADGGGLYLRTCGNSKSFLFRYARIGKTHDIGLGPFPEIDLATARERAFEFRKMLVRGVDPFEQRATVVPRATAPLLTTVAMPIPGKIGGKTFADAVKGYLDGHDKDWGRIHWKQWTTSIERFVVPTLGAMPVAEITTADVAGVLRPIWKSKAETAGRVRGRIENVLDYAKSMGWRSGENAAAWKGNLDHVLGNGRNRSKTVEHFESVPVDEIPAFYARLSRLDTTTAKALQLLTLTATRTGDVRGADWAEVGLQKRLWTIPAARMKGGQEHVVPLADGVVRLLRSMNPAASGLIFHGERSDAMGANQLNKLMATLDVNGATPHGLRGSFRMWCAEKEVPREVAEMCLAHKVGDEVEQSYQKSKLIEQRREIMEEWARYCVGA
jgi:integrase